MNSLKKKTLLLLITILSLFLLSIIIIFNTSIYNQEKKEIMNTLIRVNKNHNKIDYNHDKPISMNDEIYVVEYNMFGNIMNIINLYPDGLTEKEIINLIDKNYNKIKKNKIGSLYTNDYIFHLNNNNQLIILSNYERKNYLINTLIKTILLFIILEVIVIFISLILTKWLVKPVMETFFYQRQFICDASHELKTPIAIIQASAETLENNINEKKWLDNIKCETNKMNKLVTDLLELSKSEDIENNEVYSVIDLSKLVKKESLSFESLMYENNLSLKTEIENNIMFNCSQDRIKELLSILIDNAIKHGTKKSSIKIKLYKEKNNIILKVKNRGKEIPIDEREKIFERFYRIDKSRNRDDNRYGIGLSIAKNIVNNHKGTIKVDCQNGYTTFIISFKQN